MTEAREIYTVGHSTRSLEELVRMLKRHGIELLVDVRSIPRSRTNPQFNRDVLPGSLRPFDIEYSHLAALGGRRSGDSSSDANAGWEHPAFRSYADYALGQEFHQGLAELDRLASERRAAIMCAEAVPWRCHRRIIADYLTLIMGWRVVDIIGEANAAPHEVTPFARPAGDVITYPPQQSSLSV